MAADATGAPATDDDNDAVMSSWLTVDEETSRELSNLLESSESTQPPVKIRFAADPYSSSLTFESSSSFVTINGNEESCGSSFSDSESSVMAGLDLCGGPWGITAAKLREWLEESDVEWEGFLNDGDDDDVDAWWREVVGEDEILGQCEKKLKLEKGENLGSC